MAIDDEDAPGVVMLLAADVPRATWRRMAGLQVPCYVRQGFE